MKKGIHPVSREVVFRDITANVDYIISSTVQTNKTIVLDDGKEYPLVNVEISSASHPFYTGKQKDIKAEGRVKKFRTKYGL